MNVRRTRYDTYTPQPTGAFAGLQPDVIEEIKEKLSEGEEVWWTEPTARVAQKNVPKNWNSWFPEVMSLTSISFILSYAMITGGVSRAVWPLLIYSVGGIFRWLLFRKQETEKLWAITNQRVFFFTKRKQKSWVRSYYYNYQIKPAYLEVEPGKTGRGKLYFLKSYSLEGTTLTGFEEIAQVWAVKELLEQRLAQNSQNPVEDLPPDLRKTVNAALAETEDVLWIDLPYSNMAYLITTVRVMEVETTGHNTERVKSYRYSEQLKSTRVKLVLHENKLGDVSIMDNARRVGLETKISFTNLVEATKVEQLIKAQFEAASLRRPL